MAQCRRDHEQAQAERFKRQDAERAVSQSKWDAAWNLAA